MGLAIPKKQIHRNAFNAVHNPPSATDTIKVSSGMNVEKAKMVRELEPFLMYLYKKYLNATITEGTDLEMLKLINKAMRQMPGSPAQKKTIDQLNKLRKSSNMKPIGEGIDFPKYSDEEPKPASVYGFQSPVDVKKELDNVVDTDVIPGGLAKGMTLKDIADHHGVDFEQMKKYAELGVKTEMEHTTDAQVAYEIAKDHLYEDPKYYIKLSKIEEDLRNWFGKGKTGSTDGGGWDRYGTDGQKLGKCGDGEEGDAYAACLSKEKAAKLGPKGRASFVRRKRADQKKAGDTKKGGNRTKGKTPTFSKTKANEDINIPINVGDTILGGKFKNKRIVVKSISKNEKGDITINGKPLLKYRLLDESKLNEDCWKGYKRVGGKMKNGKMVPNCVPVNESTIQDTIKSLIDITKVPIKMGIFDDSVLSKIKQTLINGVDDSLRGEVKKLNQNQKKEFNKYANELINPLKKAKTMPEFLRAVHSIGVAKTNILSRVESSEFIGESKVLDWLKNAKNKTSDWWNRNKNDIAIIMAEFLVQLIVEILFVVLNALLKSNSLKAPKIKFGGGKFGGGGASGKWEGVINEIPMADLQKIDQFADKQLNPVDVVLTDKHFFDRLNDPRNGKEISNAELIGFFKRLAKHKKEFLEFLEKYNSVVAVDDRTNINIPFMKQANKAIAKTVMRKKDFKTPDKKLDI